ncbi:MAG: hypothetical protein ACJA01_003138 [Saprospiraceae bacterium]|jgi:hypothetical protein
MSNTIAMRFFVIFFLIYVIISCGQDKNGSSLANLTVPDKVDFNFHVKPILSDKCFACHGPDMANQKGDLRLDTKKGAFETELKSGRHPIAPGDLQNSEVYSRITQDDPDEIMPPPESNLTLSEHEIKVLTKWIEQGAEYKPHWAFTPPSEVPVPEIGEEEWPTNPIDNFVAQKLDIVGLDHSKEASKEELIRRVTFDLVGLSPSVEEIDDFVGDYSDHAFEKVVDRLLDSPHYGERMASEWLDISRYADSHGYQDDRPRTMWPWRDWVINAYNSNLPYNDFVTWQLAGDMLPDATFEQKLASGFNRNHAITQEGGVIEEEYLTEYAADRVQTFGTAFLGMTLQCARCHDHKYDPVSQKDYYQVYSFFNNITERGKISYSDLSPKPSMQYENAVLENEVEEIKTMLAQIEIEKAAFQPEIEEKILKTWYDNQNWEALKSEGLLTNYKLDFIESGTLKDEVTQAHFGTLNFKLPLTLKVPPFVPGKYGKALEFDGSNNLVIGDIGDFGNLQSFSLGAWIKPNETQSNTAGILSRRNGEHNRSGYGIYLDKNNKLRVQVVGTLNNMIDVRTKNSISKDQWTSVFGSYNGSGNASGVSLFINGKKQEVEVLSDNLDRKSIYVGTQLTIGHWMMRAKERNELTGFKGAIDEVSLYDRELSPPEVKCLYDQEPQYDSEAVYQAYLKRENKAYANIKNKSDSLRSIDTNIPKVMIMEELDSIKPAYILARGVYDAKRERVGRGTPEAILEFSDQLPQNRLGLANWLFDKRNPLTSRVIVNRYWQMLFGQGIVSSPEDFGNQGAIPSHPELLDWISSTVINDGWDMKNLVKLMVMSSTYRQSSIFDAKNHKLDPDNIYLSRGPYKKLTAEMMRDQALASSGLLNRKVGGKWVKPYQPPGIWKELANQIGENKYRQSTGSDLYRRSIYTYWKRTIPVPSMLTFDAAERAMCTVKRQATSTPLQSLVLLNDPQYIEASRKLAEELIKNNSDDPSIWIENAFKSLVTRSPSIDETDLLMDIYKAELERFEKDAESGLDVIQIGDSTSSESIDRNKLAALTIVVSAVLNLDETKHS